MNKIFQFADYGNRVLSRKRMRLRNRKASECEIAKAGDCEIAKAGRTGRTAGEARRTGGTKRKAGNKHEIAGREARSGIDLGSGDFRARRIRTQITWVRMGE